MKSILKLSLAGIALVAMAVFVSAQTSTLPAGAPVPAQAAVTAPAAVQLVCGHCGELLQAPAPVYVAQPVNPRAEARQPLPAVRGHADNVIPVPLPGQSFYGIPPVGYQYPAVYVDPYLIGGPGNRIPVPPRNVFPTHGPVYHRAPAVYYPQPYCP